MTVWTLQAPMAELSLPGGSTVTFEAIDPTTGAAVAGVTVTSFTIFGSQEGASTLEDIVPVYTPTIAEIGSGTA